MESAPHMKELIDMNNWSDVIAAKQQEELQRVATLFQKIYPIQYSSLLNFILFLKVCLLVILDSLIFMSQFRQMNNNLSKTNL